MKKEDKFVESNRASIQVLRIGPKPKESDIALLNSAYETIKLNYNCPEIEKGGREGKGACSNSTNNTIIKESNQKNFDTIKDMAKNIRQAYINEIPGIDRLKMEEHYRDIFLKECDMKIDSPRLVKIASSGIKEQCKSYNFKTWNGSFTIYASKSFDEKYIKMVCTTFSKLPDKLQQSAKGIYISKKASPDLDEARKVYGTKFNIAGSAYPEGDIVFWKEDIGLVSISIMTHELAHQLDNKGIYSNSKEYIDATQKDNNWASDYAEKSKDYSYHGIHIEDFADSVMNYFSPSKEDRETFIKNCPARTKYIEKLLGDN